MMIVYAVGPDGLDIKLPTRWLEATRGEPVEVSEEEAEKLLVHPEWEAFVPEKTTPKKSKPEEANS